MNLVVNFLSMLVSDEQNGSIKRMLDICAEFERIARVVLDRTEKESHSRKKRKPATDSVANDAPPNQANGQFSSTRPLDPPNLSMASAAFTPGMQGMSNPSFRMNGNVYSPPQMMHVPPMIPRYDKIFNGMTTPPSSGLGQEGVDGQEDSSNLIPPTNYGTFQQPFVPQDLWQMPMTLEWDWADMTNGGFPGYEHSANNVDCGIPPL